ncbi:hypothetical protein BGW80DRAFT_1275152 [Lactifluus volemus]|nr:hypothetical protein BGW80DRAFT_1275152 [Lactifluus volemus]
MLFFNFLTALLVPLAASALPIGGEENGPKTMNPKTVIPTFSHGAPLIVSGTVSGLPTQTSSTLSTSSPSSSAKACKPCKPSVTKSDSKTVTAREVARDDNTISILDNPFSECCPCGCGCGNCGNPSG